MVAWMCLAPLVSPDVALEAILGGERFFTITLRTGEGLLARVSAGVSLEMVRGGERFAAS